VFIPHPPSSLGHWPVVVHVVSKFFPELLVILPYHLHLGLLNALFPSGFPIKSLYAFLFSLTLVIEQVDLAVKLYTCILEE
jgi:hypothetical protein